MSYYSDPTAQAAMGAIDKEIRELRKLAKKIRRHQLSPAQERAARARFTGIFAHLLEEDEDQHPSGGKQKAPPESEGPGSRVKR